jgi:hypothetical protein
MSLDTAIVAAVSPPALPPRSARRPPEDPPGPRLASLSPRNRWRRTLRRRSPRRALVAAASGRRAATRGGRSRNGIVRGP